MLYPMKGGIFINYMNYEGFYEMMYIEEVGKKNESR
jgi:hypothetical protein